MAISKIGTLKKVDKMYRAERKPGFEIAPGATPSRGNLDQAGFVFYKKDVEKVIAQGGNRIKLANVFRSTESRRLISDEPIECTLLFAAHFDASTGLSYLNGPGHYIAESCPKVYRRFHLFESYYPGRVIGEPGINRIDSNRYS